MVPFGTEAFVRVGENITVILVGSKIDAKDCQVNAKQIQFHQKHNPLDYDVSDGSGRNPDKSFV